MSPDIRWLLAGACVLATLAWMALSYEHGVRHSAWTPPAVEEIGGDAPPTDNGTDLESRWLGHGVVVRHLPAAGPSRFVAHPDGDGGWTSAPEQNASSATESSDRAVP